MLLHRVRAALRRIQEIWFEFLVLNKLPRPVAKSATGTASVSWIQSRRFIYL